MDGAEMDSGGGFDHPSPDPDLRSLATLSVRVTASVDDNADGIFQRIPSRAFLARKGVDFGQFRPIELSCGILLINRSVLLGALQCSGRMVYWACGTSASTPGAQYYPPGREGWPSPVPLGPEMLQENIQLSTIYMPWPTVACASIINARHHGTYAPTCAVLERLSA